MDLDTAAGMEDTRTPVAGPRMQGSKHASENGKTKTKKAAPYLDLCPFLPSCRKGACERPQDPKPFHLFPFREKNKPEQPVRLHQVPDIVWGRLERRTNAVLQSKDSKEGGDVVQFRKHKTALPEFTES